MKIKSVCGSIGGLFLLQGQEERSRGHPADFRRPDLFRLIHVVEAKITTDRVLLVWLPVTPE